MTIDPRAVPDPLRTVAELTHAMLVGRPAFEQRLSELAGGYPSQGEGAPGNAANGGPTQSLALTHVHGGRVDAKGRALPAAVDVADMERAAFERDLRKALEHAGAMWARYQRITNTRLGVEKLTDPGCELCAKVPCGCDRCNALTGPHWCAARYTIDHTVEPKRKGQLPTTRPMKLCGSCYSFQRPDQAGRLPSHDDVLDHVEGRRRRWKAS